MSVAAPSLGPSGPAAPPRPIRRPIRLASRLGVLAGLAFKAAVGALLCSHPVGSVLVVGWTFRLMRRRILHGWWRRSPTGETLPFDAFAARQGRGSVGGALPNWIVSERFSEAIGRPGPDGSPPGPWRRLARLPVAGLAALGWNARTGLVALACTYALTGPGCLLWLAAWYDGWNNSFTKGYEQAAVGPLTGLLGSVLFMTAMLYVPMAWAHLAATADPRAFFHFNFVWRLVRHRLGAATLYAAAFSTAMLPVSVLRAAPTFFTTIDPSLETASAEVIRSVALAYNLAGGTLVFLTYVALHLLAGRLYRSAVLRALDKGAIGDDALHPALDRALRELDLIPARSSIQRHPVVAVVLGTGRRGRNAVLWTASLALWFTVVAQIFIVEFFNYHPVLGWMNQALVHLPSLYFTTSGPG